MTDIIGPRSVVQTKYPPHVNPASIDAAQNGIHRNIPKQNLVNSSGISHSRNHPTATYQQSSISTVTNNAFRTSGSWDFNGSNVNPAIRNSSTGPAVIQNQGQTNNSSFRYIENPNCDVQNAGKVTPDRRVSLQGRGYPDRPREITRDVRGSDPYDMRPVDSAGSRNWGREGLSAEGHITRQIQPPARNIPAEDVLRTNYFNQSNLNRYNSAHGSNPDILGYSRDNTDVRKDSLIATNNFDTKVPTDNSVVRSNLYFRNKQYGNQEPQNFEAPNFRLPPVLVMMEHPKRRTWSPPEPGRDGREAQRVGDVWGARRRFHSSDQLDSLGTENMYDTLDDDKNSPPNITPHSGQLNPAEGARLIRPVPCRPAMLPHPANKPHLPSFARGHKPDNVVGNRGNIPLHGPALAGHAAHREVGSPGTRRDSTQGGINFSGAPGTGMKPVISKLQSPLNQMPAPTSNMTNSYRNELKVTELKSSQNNTIKPVHAQRPQNILSESKFRKPVNEPIYESITLERSNVQAGSYQSPQNLSTVREMNDLNEVSGQRQNFESVRSVIMGKSQAPPMPAHKPHPRRSSDEGYGSREGTQQRSRRDDPSYLADMVGFSPQEDSMDSNFYCSSSGESSLNHSSNFYCFSPSNKNETVITKRSISDDPSLFCSQNYISFSPQASENYSNSMQKPSYNSSHLRHYSTSDACNKENLTGIVYNGKINEQAKIGDSMQMNLGMLSPRNLESNFKSNAANNELGLSGETVNNSLSRKFSYSARNLTRISPEETSKINNVETQRSHDTSLEWRGISGATSCRDLRIPEGPHEEQVQMDELPPRHSGPARRCMADKKRGSASAVLNKIRSQEITDRANCEQKVNINDKLLPPSGIQVEGAREGSQFPISCSPPEVKDLQEGCRSFVVIQTPSPSDSGLGEMEVVIRQKDSEIQRLRETMEKNETAIMQVLEEKKQSWEEELNNKDHEWDLKMRLQQQKSFRAEQVLLLQIFKLQQEDKNLRQNMDNIQTQLAELKSVIDSRDKDLSAERSRNADMRKELDEVLAMNKVKDRELKAKEAELVTARLQLKDAQVEYNTRTQASGPLYGNNDAHRGANINRSPAFLAQNKSNQPEQPRNHKVNFAEVDQNKNPDVLMDAPGMLTSQTRLSPLGLQELRVEFERERASWLQEKAKVVEYQKQLQLNYVQMSRKNRQLEAEVQQLTLELEAKDTNSSEGNEKSQVNQSTRLNHSSTSSITPTSC